MIDVVVPALGESISEGVIAKFNKKPGDFVCEGDIIAELETDKVTLEIPSPANGLITKITVEKGVTVAVGSIIAIIDKTATNDSKPITDRASEDSVKILMPSAAKFSREHNVNVNVKGSGKNGRILKEDLLQIEEQIDKPLPQNDPQEALSGLDEERIKMSPLRQTIAQTLKNSQNNNASLTTFNEVDVSNIIKLRQKYNEKFQKKHGIKFGFMSFFIKATIAALLEYPIINGYVEDNFIIKRKILNIGVAVGTENGLVVPVIKNAISYSIVNLEKMISELAMKAKNNRLTINDLSSGTFTITNGGIYGSLLSTPIINAKQSAILGMHNIVERPVVENGNIVAKHMMYVALSYDHRLIDGKEAVGFLKRIQELVEAPERLLLDI